MISCCARDHDISSPLPSLVARSIPLHALMTEVGIPVNMPHNIYVDNTAAGQNAEQHMNNKKTKHVAFKHLVVRDLVERGIFEMFYIPTDNNVADIGTKPLKSEAHWKHLRTLLNYTDK